MGELHYNLSQVLAELGYTPVSVDDYDDFILVVHNNGNRSYLFEDMDQDDIRRIITEEMKGPGPQDDITGGVFELSSKDRKALEFAKDVQKEVERYRNIGGFLVGLVLFATPWLIDYAASLATIDAMHASAEMHAGLLERLIRLENGPKQCNTADLPSTNASQPVRVPQENRAVYGQHFDPHTCPYAVGYFY